MATRITFIFGDDGSEEVVDKQLDAFARALLASLETEREVTPPRAAFDDLLLNLAQVSRTINDLEHWRELAIVAADKTSPDAHRNLIGIAAKLPPSRVYRILDRHGRPRDRNEVSQRDIVERAIGDEGGSWTPARTVAVLGEAGHDVTPKRARQILRDIADTGWITKIDPHRAIYRITEQ